MTVKIIRLSKPLWQDRARFEQNLKQELSLSLDRIKQRQLILRNRVTATWEGMTPKWTISKGSTAHSVFMSIGFTTWGEPKSGNRKWLWLSEGTKIRYAHMRPGFKAKTAVRQLNSGSGSGELWIVTKALPPKPGIDARYFDNEIMTRLEAPTRSYITSAVRKALLS